MNEMKTTLLLILNLPNTVIGKFSKNKNLLPLWLSAVVLGIFICLPSYAVVLIVGETQQLKDLGWTVFTSLLLSYLSVIVMYLDIHVNISGKLNQKIIPSLTSEKDLADLKICLEEASFGKSVPAITILGIFIGLTALIGGSAVYGKQPGLGLPLSALFFGAFGGTSIYYLVWVLRLTRLMGHFDFPVFEFTPASSKIIYDISGMLNTHVYSLAFFVAVVTIIDSLDKLTSWFIYMDVLFGWIPIISQFFVTQKAIRNIIARAKWRTLEQIQSEIRALKFSGIDHIKETTDSINQLLDLHNRIEKTRNSTFNFRSGLNFLNQLLMPVLGWAVGNLDKILNKILLFLNQK